MKAMDKTILAQYIDACELIKETEEDIRKLRNRRQTVVQEVVKGSAPDFPYTAKTFHVSGMPYLAQDSRLEAEEKLLEERRAAAEMIKVQVERWMLTVPVRMQRIIRYKFFEGMTWRQVAIRMGWKASGDSVRLEFERFLQKI